MVERMTYLSKYPNIQYMTAVDDANNPEMFPKFYLGQWPVMNNEKSGNHSLDSILASSLRKGIEQSPRFVLFTGDGSIGPMVIRARQYLPFLVYETKIEPGFIDRLMHWLNPINRNKTVYIYRNTIFFPQRKQV